MTTPYPALTDRSTVLAKAIIQKIRDNIESLGLDDVLYGDQNNIPKGKSAVVNSLEKTRELAGVGGPGGRTENTLRVAITVHYSVYESEATARLAADELAEDIEHLLHQDTTMGGIIIHGFISRWDPGITFKPGTMFRSVFMEFRGITKSQLTDIP